MIGHKYMCANCGVVATVKFSAQGFPILLQWLGKKGEGILLDYNFCGYSCLKQWVENHPNEPEKPRY